MTDHSDQVLVHLEYIRAKQDETTLYLKSLETRMGKVENRVTAIEARGDEARHVAARWAAAVAAVISAVIAAASGFIGWNRGATP